MSICRHDPVMRVLDPLTCLNVVLHSGKNVHDKRHLHSPNTSSYVEQSHRL